jgi:hypothetical protein
MGLSSLRQKLEIYSAPCGTQRPADYLIYRFNMIPIIETLKHCLEGSDDETLFVDISFSKSRSYHWIINTCHDLCASIQTNLKFLQNFESNRLPALQAKAHPYENLGVSHWTSRLTEEISGLETLQGQIHIFREQVREMVSHSCPHCFWAVCQVCSLRLRRRAALKSGHFSEHQKLPYLRNM